MNTPEIHAKWRVLPVHLVAKLFGVLVHVDGAPFGSSRGYFASPHGQPGANGGAIGSSIPACESKLPE